MATLAQIRTRIRQRTDHEHDVEAFVTDLELNQLIRKSQYELFGLLVNAGVHTVPELEFEIQADGAVTYQLPGDFFAVQGVFRDNNGYFYRLVRHGARTKPYDDLRSDASSYRTWGYTLDATIELSPRPDKGRYVIRYIPAPTELVTDADVLDGVLGWEEYIVVDVGIDVLMKEGIKPDYLIGKKLELTDRIKKESRMRDLLETHQVGDSRWRSTDTLFDEQGFLPGGNRGVIGYSWRF
jgi:hypothetical protein